MFGIYTPGGHAISLRRVKEAVDSGDIRSLEGAIYEAETSLGHCPDHNIQGAKRLLNAWRHRCRKELRLLEDAYRTRRTQALVDALVVAESSAHARMLNSDIMKGKGILIQQERAMEEIEDIVASKDALSLGQFLEHYREVLPDDVVSELTDLRRKFVRHTAATRRSPSLDDALRQIPDGVFLSPGSPRYPDMVTSVPYIVKESPAKQLVGSHLLGSAVKPQASDYPALSMMSTTSGARLTPSLPFTDTSNATAELFSQEFYFLESTERSQRSDVHQAERNERVALVKFMMLDLRRVKDLQSTWHWIPITSPSVSPSPNPPLDNMMRHEAHLRREMEAEEVEDRRYFQKRFENMKNALIEHELKYSHLALAVQSPDVSIVASDATAEPPSHHDSHANEGITEDDIREASTVPYGRFLQVVHEFEEHKQQFLVTLHGSQLVLTFEQFKSGRNDVATEEARERAELYRVVLRGSVQQIQRANQTASAWRLHAVESEKRRQLETVGNLQQDALRDLVDACFEHDRLVEEERVQFYEFEQPALEALWTLFSEM